MEPLFSQIVRLADEDARYALGTVVYTSGSTPQRTGARALFLPDGTLLGTLGGGCMEAEARRRGILLTAGGSPDLLELNLDDDFGWDDGLICGGTAHILLQPRPTRDQEDVYRKALELYRANGRGVLAMLVSGEGRPGACCLVQAAAETVGSLGDRELQREVEEACRGLLLEGRDEPRRLRLADGAQLYVEPILPRPICLIAGAGHIGAALAHYASKAGFDVAIIDDRASLCNSERIPDADTIVVGDIAAEVRNWPKTPDTYVVIVTRGHRHDAVVLREVIDAPVAYVGMIGSKRKILTIYREFVDEGLATSSQLARVHAPIGLDIGAVSVEEIALCIAAELIQVRRKGQSDVGSVERDCAGGGRVASDGDAEAALALRQRHRAASGASLTQGLPAL